MMYEKLIVDKGLEEEIAFDGDRKIEYIGFLIFVD